MKNFQQIVDSSDLGPLSEIKGLRRVLNRTGPGKMSMTADIAFQTAAAASRFRASFYDLSLKLLGTAVTDRLKVPHDALSIFTKSLAVIRLENGLPSHDAIAKDFQPFDHPEHIYRVLAVDRGCVLLFGGYHHFDTFVMSVTSARDSSAISGEQAAALIFKADDLYDALKKGLLSPQPAPEGRG